MIEIDKGIPIPAPKKKGGSEAKWPWRKMAVGDSFVMEGATEDAAVNGAYKAAKRIGNGVKFATRKVDGGVRIWRIK